MKDNSGLKLAIVGTGGAGCNMLNNIITSFNLNGYLGLDSQKGEDNQEFGGVTIQFIACNSDSSLRLSKADKKIQLGASGRGAGSDANQGKEAAEYSAEEIRKTLQGFDLVLVIAGFGGGTGTGSSPTIAKIAKESGALVIGIATKPFSFEGRKRAEIAQEWIENFKQNTDITVILLNQLLFKIADANTTFKDAFKFIDNFIKDIVMAIVYILGRDGTVNVDFSDLTSVISEKQTGIIGLGYGEGTDAAHAAVQMAMENSLIENTNIKGSKDVLIHLTANESITLDDVNVIVGTLQTTAGDAQISYGLTIEQTKGDIFEDTNNKWIKLFFIATGITDQTRQNIEDQIRQQNFEVAQQQAQQQLDTSARKSNILHGLSNKLNNNKNPNQKF